MRAIGEMLLFDRLIYNRNWPVVYLFGSF